MIYQKANEIYDRLYDNKEKDKMMSEIKQICRDSRNFFSKGSEEDEIRKINIYKKYVTGKQKLSVEVEKLSSVLNVMQMSDCAKAQEVLQRYGAVPIHAALLNIEISNNDSVLQISNPGEFDWMCDFYYQVMGCIY